QAQASIDVLRGALARAQAAAWSLGRSPDGSPCADADGHGDREIWELLGVPQREERPFEERLRCAVHPEDFPQLLDTTRDALLRQEPFEVAFRTHPQSGPIRWILKRGQPDVDANQQCRRFTGLCVDITQQKRVEQAHAEALRRLSRASELAGIGHFRYDVARGDVEYDAVVQRMVDLPEGRAHLEQIRRSVAPASLQALHNGFAQFVSRREDKFEGTLALVPGGSVRYLRVQVEPERDAAGDVLGFFGVVFDITEQHATQRRSEATPEVVGREAEAALHAVSLKEGELSAILGGLPCAVGYWDADARGGYANEAHDQRFGMAPADMAGRPIFEVWRGSYAVDLAARVDAVLAGRAQTYELEVNPPLDTEMDRGCANIHLLPVQSDGKTHGFFSLLFDVSALKHAEQQAEAARTAKGQLLVNMSHEIRTPLTAMLGLAELGAGSSPSREVADCFANIQCAGKHLLSVVSDILDFSRIEAGKLDIVLGTLDVGELIAQVVTTVGTSARAKGLALRFHELTGLPRKIRTDGARVAQVMMNVLSNAVKFTEVGSVVTTLGYAAGQLSIQVEDTGVGIPETTQTLLFQPFEQGVMRGGDRRGGTGLGLAICKRIVGLMNGTLQISSKQAGGTTVRMTIPCEVVAQADMSLLQHTAFLGFPAHEVAALSRALELRGCRTEILEDDALFPDYASTVVVRDGATRHFDDPGAGRFVDAGGRLLCLLQCGEPRATQAFPREVVPHVAYAQHPATPLTLLLALDLQTEQAERSLPSRKSLPLKGVRVLAAEDHALNRLLLREMLTAAGATLVCVEDGRRVVEQLMGDGADAFHVVLCDIEMPELDGYGATMAMRAFAPDLPIIGLTAHAFELARERGRSAGMTDYITKPYSLKALTQAIARHLPTQPGLLRGPV
ncbi:MAG: hypothetical protein RL385_3825, partial [Pseudomonadota bacterium]